MINISLEYRLDGQKNIVSTALSPEYYFELEDGELAMFDSFVRFDDELEYADLSSWEVDYTRITVFDDITNSKRQISSCYWNDGKNCLSERIDTLASEQYRVFILETEHNLNTPGYSLINSVKYVNKDNNSKLEFHYIYIKDPNGDYIEQRIYPPVSLEEQGLRMSFSPAYTDWKQKIYQEGRKDAAHSMLIRLLSHKFGSPDSKTISQIQSVTDIEKLEQLAVSLPDIPDLQSLFQNF
jgi:hypothetical protein